MAWRGRVGTQIGRQEGGRADGRAGRQTGRQWKVTALGSEVRSPFLKFSLVEVCHCLPCAVHGARCWSLRRGVHRASALEELTCSWKPDEQVASYRTGHLRGTKDGHGSGSTEAGLGYLPEEVVPALVLKDGGFVY